MNIRNFKSVEERRGALEIERSVNLANIGSFSLDELVASTRNCENMIGIAQVPMGIAGPLKISCQLSAVSRQLKSDYYIPLATTEGALVASISRGCKAISQSGGATVDSYRAGTTRGPVFKVKNLQESKLLNTFLEVHFDELVDMAKKTSHHLTLKKYMDRGVGRYRYVRFVFDTQNAMGMNMVTIATQKLVEFISDKTGVECIALAGNYDIDKKPAWLNIVEGRGFKVWAEVIIPSRILTGILKTTAQKVYDVWLAKCMIGSAMSGSMGFNAQYANVIAAVFLATGQDLGHVGEGSLGITTAEVIGEDLYMSVYLPDLLVGTVGGGTGLATQKEALNIIGDVDSVQLAQIIVGAVLAGEVSLLASLAQGSLARAHERLGRGK